MNELDILEYRIDKGGDRMDRIEEHHDKQFTVLESDVSVLRADLFSLKDQVAELYSRMEANASRQ